MILGVIRKAFHDERSSIHRTVHIVVSVMVLISVALVAVELSLSEDHPALEWIALVDRTLLLLFVAELVARVGSYRPPELGIFKLRFDRRLRVQIMGRLRFCMRPMILVDIVTVVALIPALRGLRVLRLLRLLKLSRYFRFSSPLAAIGRAFFDNRLLYAGAFSFLGGATIIGGATIFLVEGRGNPDINSVGDGLWWSIVTITTVGFGDISPITPLGRMVGAVLMVVGMFTLALFAGLVGQSLLNSVLSLREEQFRMNTHNNHIVICGYTPGARMFLDTLRREQDWGDREVLIFAEGERPKDVPPEFSWVNGDPTKESELIKVRLTHADGVIVVGARDVLPQQADATTILTVFTIRHWMSRQSETKIRKKPLYVVAEILDLENIAHAEAAGASEVIESTLVSFSLLAHAMSMPGSAHALSRISEARGNSLYVGRLPQDIELPLSFAELSAELRARCGLLLVGVSSEGGEQRLNPSDDMPIGSSHRLVYLATEPKLEPI